MNELAISEERPYSQRATSEQTVLDERRVEVRDFHDGERKPPRLIVGFGHRISEAEVV